MQIRETLEVAALVSAYCPHVLSLQSPLPPQRIESFWDRSQQRAKFWLGTLDYYHRRRDNVTPRIRMALWEELYPVLEEILVADVLSRVWGAVLIGLDHELKFTHYEPLARHILLSHLDCRRRALAPLIEDHSIPDDLLTGLDRLRRRTERWTDMLLGPLMPHYPVEDFAFDAERSRDFSEQFESLGEDRPYAQIWSLILAGIRLGCTDPEQTRAPSASDWLSHEIQASILGCYPADALEPVGPFQKVLEEHLHQAGMLHDSQTRTTTQLPKLSFSPTRPRRSDYN